MRRILGLCSIFISVSLALGACGASPTSLPTPPTGTPPPPAATLAPTTTATPVPPGETIVVTSIEDSGDGSLRAALQAAQPGDSITFDPAVFPPEAPAVIALLRPLDGVRQGSLTIDATGAGVILDGSRVSGPFKSAIELQSDHNIIRGLQAVHFPGPGLGISDGGGNLLEGNVLGENEYGIGLWGTRATGNRILNNFVGVLADGLTAQGNSSGGIILMEGASGNSLGPGNVIAFNQQNGIEIVDPISIQNHIFENSIHDNIGGGIGLGEGSNEGLDAPRLMSFDLGAGSVDGLACPGCEVLFYSDAHDQGAFYEGSTVADAQGSFFFEKRAAFAGPALTATSIDAAGNTSAFSFPASGAARSRQLQDGNTEPRALLTTKTSDELEDNGIGGLWSPREPGFFEEVIDYEIVPLGLKRVRLQFNEGEYDSTGGGERSIDWSRPEMPIPTDMEDIVPRLLQHGIDVDYVLIFWDKAHHPQGWTVQPRFKTQEEIDRYLEYVRYVATTFKGKVRYYELWNEPHIPYPLQEIEVNDYIQVASLAIPIIHAVDPEARVSVGAAVTANPGPRDYLFKILESELMDLADIVSWHPFYGNIPGAGKYPEYYAGYRLLLDQIKDTARAHGFQGEFIADELSYSSEVCGGCEQSGSVSEIQAAKYTARVVTLHRGSDVMAGVGGISSARSLHYSTLQNLDNVLAGAEAAPFNVKVQTTVKDVKLYTFGRNDGSMLVAIWNDGPAADEDPGVPSTISIPGFANWQATGIDVLNGFEQELIQEGHAGLLTINGFLLKDYPIFIRLSK